MKSQLSQGAAKAAKNKLNCDRLSNQDYEDVVSSATLGSLKAQASPKHSPVYEFVAAKNEAVKFIISQVFKGGSTDRLKDLENYEGEPEFISQLEIDESQLADMFLKHRVKRGQRGYKASRRDARICKLILEGYSNEGIAQELGQSPHNIRRYRTDIRHRLREVAKQKGHPVE